MTNRSKLTFWVVLGLHVEAKNPPHSCRFFLGSVFEAEGVNGIPPVSRFCRNGNENSPMVECRRLVVGMSLVTKLLMGLREAARAEARPW